MTANRTAQDDKTSVFLVSGFPFLEKPKQTQGPSAKMQTSAREVRATPMSLGLGAARDDKL